MKIGELELFDIEIMMQQLADPEQLAALRKAFPPRPGHAYLDEEGFTCIDGKRIKKDMNEVEQKLLSFRAEQEEEKWPLSGEGWASYFPEQGSTTLVKISIDEPFGYPRTRIKWEVIK